MYGLYSNSTPQGHLHFLTEALNVAVLLCAEFCIVPPGFIAECPIARRAINRRIPYLTERIIRLPMREATLDELFIKKQRQYAPFREKYKGLFDRESQRFIKKAPQAIVSRDFVVVDGIVDSWETGLDDDYLWRELARGTSMPTLERIRRIPKQVRDDEIAVTWPAIRQEIGENIGVNPERFRLAVQHHYFGVYLKEYNLRVVTGLPFSRVNFSLGSGDLRYDYDALKDISESVGVWPLLSNMAARFILLIRHQAGFFRFRENLDLLAKISNSRSDMQRAFAIASERCKKELASSRLDPKHESVKVAPAAGIELSTEEIEKIVYRLEVVSKAALDDLYSLSQNPRNDASSFAHTSNSNEKGKKIMSDIIPPGQNRSFATIMLFVALEMERRILVDRWGLKKAYGELFWKGMRSNVQILLYSSSVMGRVPAAIHTMQALEREKPDMLIVTGIAGGFKESGCQLGDLLVASLVADLATRKIKENAEQVNSEFRPDAFAIDDRMKHFVESGEFDRGTWEQYVIKAAEWPEGRRPTIHIAPLASLDEVVASGQWINSLLAAWPKLLGVEMEAGGVCAAAKEFKIEAAVIRGVSDLADPTKSDSEWRRRAMKTAACLIEHFIDSGVIHVRDKNKP